jgi:hypothetical protein
MEVMEKKNNPGQRKTKAKGQQMGSAFKRQKPISASLSPSPFTLEISIAAAPHRQLPMVEIPNCPHHHFLTTNHPSHHTHAFSL